MRKTTIAVIGAALVATTVGIAGATAGGWGPGHGMGPGMMGGPGMMMMGPAGGPMRLFEELDADKDGKLTKAELDAGRAAKFKEADKDGQGGVTIAEFEPWFWAQHREMMVRAFQFLDADGDGSVTEAELATLTDRMIERMDRNGDGTLSPDDRPHRGMRGEGWGRGDGPRGDRGHHGWWGGRQAPDAPQPPAGGPADPAAPVTPPPAE